MHKKKNPTKTRKSMMTEGEKETDLRQQNSRKWRFWSQGNIVRQKIRWSHFLARVEEAESEGVRTYSHVGDGFFQEVLDKLELGDEAMQETAQNVEKELNLHDVVSEEEKQTKMLFWLVCCQHLTRAKQQVAVENNN